MKTRNIIILTLSILVLMGCGKDTKQTKLFKEKVYMGFYCSSLIADHISMSLSDYDKGLRYFRASDARMTGSEGDYCNEPKEVAKMVLEAYNGYKMPEAISTYMETAYSKLPKDDEKLEQLYQQAVKLQRLAVEPRGTATTYQVQVSDIEATFLRLLDESDTDLPDTKIDREAKQEEALRFVKTLSGV